MNQHEMLYKEFMIQKRIVSLLTEEKRIAKGITALKIAIRLTMEKDFLNQIKTGIAKLGILTE